jgi:hypothetical protein
MNSRAAAPLKKAERKQNRQDLRFRQKHPNTATVKSANSANGI